MSILYSEYLGFENYNSKPSNKIDISLKEFNSLLNDSCRYLKMKPEFYPQRWKLLECSKNNFDSLSYYKFRDVYNRCDYTITFEKILVEISNQSTFETININIPIPDSLWYQIQYCINKTSSMIEQINRISDFKKEDYKIKNPYIPVKNKKTVIKKPSLTKDEEELVLFLESIQEKSFDEIFSSIVKYRIQQYNKGKTNDIVFPYNKTKHTLDKLKKVLLDNNYEQFSSLKKWADKVIFLDNKEK